MALLLSEILSPGSQNLQNASKTDIESGNASPWFTPYAVDAATHIGHQLHETLYAMKKDATNWNRIFNLMSTKYF